MNKEKNFTLKDFGNIDNSEQADFFINSIKAHYKHPSMCAIKKNAIKKLKLSTNDHVLDLGCGIGYDSKEIAKKIYPLGTVVGVDISQRMIDEANKNNTLKNLYFERGNAECLRFKKNNFDACYVDRLLVSQKNIYLVLDEIKRVLKMGGKLAITCLDFDSINFFPHCNQINKIINHWRGLVKNPTSGRQLPTLIMQKNFELADVSVGIFYLKNYNDLLEIVPFNVMLNNMKDLRKISKKKYNDLSKAINDAQQTNTFYWSINLTTVIARKHSD